jgi:hypothetical protein
MSQSRVGVVVMSIGFASSWPVQRCTFFLAPAFLPCSWDSPPLRQEGAYGSSAASPQAELPPVAITRSTLLYRDPGQGA